MDSFGCATFGEEVGSGKFVSSEQEVADNVCTQAIDFFRHAHVARSQARLHMTYRDPQLFGRDSAGECRIHIADDDQDGLFQFGIDMCLRGIDALVGKKS